MIAGRSRASVARYDLSCLLLMDPYKVAVVQSTVFRGYVERAGAPEGLGRFQGAVIVKLIAIGL